MKILILAAMEKEMNLLLNLLTEAHERAIGSTHFWEGKIDKHQMFIAKCGIGKVNAAINTYKLIELTKPELVINSGVAGGAGTPIGTLLIASQVAYHDVWCGPGTKYGQADGLPLFMEPSEIILQIGRQLDLETGLICSGDKFISSAQEISDIRSHFPEVKAVDMESASIAQTCIYSGIPFAIIRVISDTPGEGENISQYKDFWNTAPQKTFAAISNILKELK